MNDKGWDFGKDQEELFELAMHERQYMDFRNGTAKNRFLKDIEDAKAKCGAPIIVKRPVVEIPKIDIDDIRNRYPDAIPIQATAKGKILWPIDVIDVTEKPLVGTSVCMDSPIGHIQTYYELEEINVACDGRILCVWANQGDSVVKGEIIAFMIPSMRKISS